MRIYYDGFIYGLQSLGGINRYFAELINHLSEDFTPQLSTTQIRSLMFPKHKYLIVDKYPRFAFKPGRLAYALEGFYFRKKVSSSKASIIHPTYYSFLTQQKQFPSKIPVVATIFDLVHERYPDITDPEGHARQAKKRLINSADIIISLSEYTKRDIIQYYSVHPDKINVIYPGPPALPTPNKIHSDIPYFLFVGSRWSYKNFSLVLKSIKELISKNIEVNLYCSGPALNKEEKSLIQELKLEPYVKDFGIVDDQTLSNLYAGATALLYPSFFEGFGFPLLEAMSCKTAIIASSYASIPEVVGDAGLFVAKDCVTEMTFALEKILSDTELRKTLLTKGTERVKSFSWERCANETSEIYNSLVQR